MNTQKLPTKPQTEDSDALQVQLIYLSPEQIAENWEEVKVAIEAALPPMTYANVDVLSNILKGILRKDVQCWGIYVKGDLKALATTTITVDLLSGVKNLLIYSIYGYEAIGIQTWLISLEQLRKYARSKGCHRLVAYTKEEKIVRLIEMLKGDISWKFVILEVN